MSMQKLLKLSSRSIATTSEYAFPTQIEQILFSVYVIGKADNTFSPWADKPLMLKLHYRDLLCKNVLYKKSTTSTSNRSSGVWVSIWCGLVVALKPITVQQDYEKSTRNPQQTMEFQR